jgi:DNA-binding GntR family transcriptional regulator
MQRLESPAQLIEQVYDTILDAICDGTLPPNERVTQEGLAERLGVSRQPILQAFQILKRQGFIVDAGRKGVAVTPLDPVKLVQLYQVRAALDALAARLATGAVQRLGGEACRAEGGRLILAGRQAAQRQDVSLQVQADMDFHRFIYRLSGNPVIEDTTAIHWQHIRRTMSAILRSDVRTLTGVWDEHQAILDAVLSGDGDAAARLAQQHAESAAEHLARLLESEEHASKRQQG